MRKKIIPIIIGIIVVSSAALAGIILIKEPNVDVKNPSETDDDFSAQLNSGPFTILKYEYKLGERVFLVVDGLQENEKGNIKIFTPEDRLFLKIPFDGFGKSSFNQYFKPDTAKSGVACDPEELVGIWTVVFEGVSYQPIKFEFINEYIQGGEADIKYVC